MPLPLVGGVELACAVSPGALFPSPLVLTEWRASAAETGVDPSVVLLSSPDWGVVAVAARVPGVGATRAANTLCSSCAKAVSDAADVERVDRCAEGGT